MTEPKTVGRETLPTRHPRANRNPSSRRHVDSCESGNDDKEAAGFALLTPELNRIPLLSIHLKN